MDLVGPAPSLATPDTIWVGLMSTDAPHASKGLPWLCHFHRILFRCLVYNISMPPLCSISPRIAPETALHPSSELLVTPTACWRRPGAARQDDTSSLRYRCARSPPRGASHGAHRRVTSLHYIIQECPARTLLLLADPCLAGRSRPSHDTCLGCLGRNAPSTIPPRPLHSLSRPPPRRICGIACRTNVQASSPASTQHQATDDDATGTRSRPLHDLTYH